MDRNILVVAILMLGVGIFVAYQNKNNANSQQPVVNQWQNWEQPNVQTQPETPPPPVAPEEVEPKSYKEALQIAQRQNKQVFLFFHASWCHWCEKMNDETLENDKVKSALSNYVVYHVDTQKERSIASKYNVRGIPAYVVADKSGSALKNGNGFKSSNDFIKWLNENPDNNRNRRPDSQPPK